MWIQMYEKMLRFKRLWIDDDVDMVHVDNINDSKYDLLCERYVYLLQITPSDWK
jgi:hypothetical protein